jgi:hypothetical protein
MRKTTGYTGTDYTINTEMSKKPNITPVLNKIQKKLVATHKQKAP